MAEIATNCMTRAELCALAASSPTTDVPTASKAFGFGSNLGYELIRRGEFPCRVFRLGRIIRVPTADLLDALGIHTDSEAAHDLAG
jgi:hypothetical protein